MKTSSILMCSALFGTLGVCSASAGAELKAVANLQAQFGLKFKLTANTETFGGDVLKGAANDSTAKFVSITFTQKDWLIDLIEEREIAGPLAGWSIVARTDSKNFAALNYRLYAVKKGQPDYPLDPEDARSLSFESLHYVEEFKARYTYATELIAGSGTIREHDRGTFTTGEDVLYLGGLVTIPYSYKTQTLNQTKVSVIVPGSITLKLTGGAVFITEEMGPLQVIAEGDITMTSHTVTALAPLAVQ